MSMLEPFHHGEYRTGKTNDCAVRALSNVTLFEYEECERVLEEHGRRPNKGVSLKQMTTCSKILGLNKVETFGKSSHGRMLFAGVLTKQQKAITLKTFLKKYSKGRFVVLYYKHAVAVIDGQIVDKIANRPNARVIATFSNLI